MTSDTDRLGAIVRPHATVAGKIRALSAAGVPRADIARFLGKRYQHVRNVLEGDAQTGGGYVLGKADLSGVQDPGVKFENAEDEGQWVERRGGDTYWLRPRPDGSLVLPKEVAQALGVMDGRRVRARFRDNELNIVSAETSMEEARALVRKYIKVEPGVSIVDEFIAERRTMWGEDD
jgi:hypothetical protein